MLASMCTQPNILGSISKYVHPLTIIYNVFILRTFSFCGSIIIERFFSQEVYILLILR